MHSRHTAYLGSAACVCPVPAAPLTSSLCPVTTLACYAGQPELCYAQVSESPLLSFLECKNTGFQLVGGQGVLGVPCNTRFLTPALHFGSQQKNRELPGNELRPCGSP